MTEPWKSEIFDIFNDFPTLIMGWLCAGYLFGTNAEKIDGSNKINMCIAYFCLTNCYLCGILHKKRRQALREKYGLEEKPSDFVATCCFSFCANCQEAREMQARGEQPAVPITISSQPR